MENYPPKTNSSFALKAKTTKTTIKKADEFLQTSMRGEHKVMATRWGRMNRMLLGGFHFGQMYLIAGASGHGKSYFLNMIQRDCMNKAINNPKFSFKILHFGFEMSAEVEFLRRIASLTKVPYRKLIASDDPLTQEEYDKVSTYYSLMEDEPIYYFETPGTRYEIEATIKKFHERFPDDQLIVTLDHSLLVVSERGEDEIKTLSELAKIFITLKKQFGLLTIILGQLNDKIEGERRRDPTNPSLHYPTKTDIHGSKQLYHAVDVCLVIHQPSLLNLEYYGKNNIPTKDLIAIHQLKQRNGAQGFILMDNDLKHGQMHQRRREEEETRKKAVANAVIGATRD